MTVAPWPVAVALGGNLPPARPARDRRPRPRTARLAGEFPLFTALPHGTGGGPPGQPPYCNAVVLFATTLTPEGLLEALQALEAAGGRERLQPWGPRTLDLDLLWHGSHERDDPHLVLPHPRLLERSFVLAPLVALDPGLVPPGQPDPSPAATWPSCWRLCCPVCPSRPRAPAASPGWPGP